MHVARRATLGQKHDCLPGRVTRTNDRDIGTVVQVSFNGRAGIVETRTGKAIRSVGLEAPPVNSEREQQYTPAYPGAAGELEQRRIHKDPAVSAFNDR